MQQKFLQSLSPLGFHRIAYVEWGAASAQRTIVCVHGLTRNSRDFDKIAAALAECGARVISVDIVGRGLSDWLADPALYNHDQYLIDMTALLARLDVETIDWIGTSMGGLIGMALAAQPNSPIRRLVLNDVGPFIPQAAMQRIGSYVGLDPRFHAPEEVIGFFHTYYAKSGPCTEEDIRHLAAHGTRLCPDGSLGLAYDPAIAQNFLTIQGDVDFWPAYDRIACPTLVLHGEISDVLTASTADEMTRRGPKAQLVTISGIGHTPGLMDDPQITLVRSFLGL